MDWYVAHVYVCGKREHTGFVAMCTYSVCTYIVWVPIWSMHGVYDQCVSCSVCRHVCIHGMYLYSVSIHTHKITFGLCVTKFDENIKCYIEIADLPWNLLKHFTYKKVLADIFPKLKWSNVLLCLYHLPLKQHIRKHLM